MTNLYVTVPKVWKKLGKGYGRCMYKNKWPLRSCNGQTSSWEKCKKACASHKSCYAFTYAGKKADNAGSCNLHLQKTSECDGESFWEVSPWPFTKAYVAKKIPGDLWLNKYIRTKSEYSPATGQWEVEKDPFYGWCYYNTNASMTQQLIFVQFNSIQT